MTTPELDVVLAYHEATKHHLNRYARGPHGLDWANQPNPFRRYTGAPLIGLDHAPPGKRPLPPYYEEVFIEGRLQAVPLDRTSVSRLFYDSLALSAWKQVGDSRWSLRVNPSSGNLHPTEGYLICGPIDGLADQPMVGHYAPLAHGLERRTEFPLDLWRSLTADLPDGTILIGLTSIHWREAWKYGERAFRYCQHDTGHAIATVTLAAAALGWKATLLDDLSTDVLSVLLGLTAPDTAEPEEPECLIAVYPQGVSCSTFSLPEAAIKPFRSLSWTGQPNRLSREQTDWPIIEQAATATRKPATDAYGELFRPTGPSLPVDATPISFRTMIHQRRSCLALDGKTGITRIAFYQILRKTIPGPGQFPFTVFPWPPRIHFGLFVHRVEGIDPGLYCLIRDPAQFDPLKRAMKQEFAWEIPAECPDGLMLYRLLTGDAQELSQQISCHQEIASEGVFSLGMIAEYEAPLARCGAWCYRRLFWEAGLVGQVLYLEAEASGIRGTGIGCYFDDPMHAVLGLTDRRFQDLYHFTMGGTIEDKRLTTLPAYPHM